ncbi:MAG: T9SS type A sorting domain-containing protein [Bacteroidetes bacterium]|nr:T9SS type A sorting domain-containing protein [Bacteroidota bacterium]
MICLFWLLNNISIAVSQQTLDATDSLLRAGLPELRLPEQFRSLQLPPVVDNSTQPYFRPIFNQSGASCGQAAGVAYNFTYEMCRRLNRDASLPENQFPSHFVYNFMNYNGYYGVNYYHSFEVLRTLGTPTLAAYGGMAIDNGNKWISGYDFYRNAMRNRIKKVHRIKTNTVEGLLTLKHWLAHHLDGSAVGGVANFNAASPWGLQPLPAGTPEAGKLAMIYFQGHQATHAMTIVGYDDSIRWDYNGDGQYTNHLDINGDGVVDLLDYEIGAFKVANSYGENWANGGYFYMMYRLLALDVYDGGIWNQQVEVLELNEPYEPKLTLKLTLRHNKREQIRINAGVSADTADMVPAHRLMFPVFNFQGGPQYMQGGTSDPLNQYIEIGLDLTPLLSYLDSGQAARFFLEVLENDTLGSGSGEIVYFALRDYNGPQAFEIPCTQTNVPIADNSLTRLSVVHTPVFDDVLITTPYIPLYDAGHQLAAEGGTPPYEWKKVQNYRQQSVDLPFPQAQQQQLQLESPNYRYARKTIDFEFPFYGEKYSEIFMHRDGFLLFGPELFPWPYYKDTWLLFRTMKHISAFLVSPIQYYPGTKGADGMWYEGDATHATFRWKKPVMYYDKQIGYGEFALTLYPDGKITFHYNNLDLSEPVLWYAGVSAGEQSGHVALRGSGGRLVPAGKSFVLLPEFWPDGVDLASDGFLWGAPAATDKIHNLSVRVEDARGLADQKQFQLGDLVVFDMRARNAAGGSPEAGNALLFDLFLRNLSTEPLTNVQLILESPGTYLSLNQNIIIVDIPASGAIELPEAFSGILHPRTPDGDFVPLEVNILTPYGTRQGQSGFVARAPEIVKLGHQIQDSNNNRLDPGETAPLVVKLANLGTASATALSMHLESLDPYVSVSEPVILLPVFPPGAELAPSFQLTASASCPVGHLAMLRFVLVYQGDTLINQTVVLKIGQYPLFVFLRSSSDFSSQMIRNTLEQLEVPYVFGAALPDSLHDFRAVFACLGGVTTSGSLSNAQAAQLATFLHKGGRLYLEGSAVWAFNRPPQLYEMFSVYGNYLSSSIPATNIVGVPGSFTEGLVFAHANPAVPYFFFDVAPAGDAFALLRPQDHLGVTLMTGYQTPVYKTIASAVEFGYLDPPGNSDSRKVLMSKMLDFFDLGGMITGSRPQDYHSHNSLRLWPNPADTHLNLEFNEFDPERCSLRIFNASGGKVFEMELAPTSGANRIIVDVSGLPQGVYVLQLVREKDSQIARFIKK